MSQHLSQKLGESIVHGIPMKWKGRPFSPGNAWALTFTVKSSPDTQDDSAAAFQKATGGGGITLSDSMAMVHVVRPDTKGSADPPRAALAPGDYFWGIQAAQVSNQSNTRQVAHGTLELEREVTREPEPVLDVYSVNPPLLFFSYQAYLDTNPDPVLTEEQWVARLGSSNPAIVSIVPPVPLRGGDLVPPRTFSMPYEGMQWFDPSDGSTSHWVWIDPDATNDSEEDGYFISDFPTPADTGVPDNAYTDELGYAYIDDGGNYYIESD